MLAFYVLEVLRVKRLDISYLLHFYIYCFDTLICVVLQYPL